MKRNLVFVYFGAVAFLAAAVAAVELPEFLHVCSRDDPQINSCVTESVEYLKPYLMKGVPEYNIPALEPLLLKELVAAEGAGIRITAKDVKAHGASNFYVKKLKVDLETHRIGLDVDLPHLYIRGLYDVNGRVLLLPIRGSGPMTGNFTSCTGAVRIQYQLVKDEAGAEYADVNDFKLRISIGKGSLQLDNLFGGEKVLGDVVNNAINSNFDAFIREIQPAIEKALSDAFLDIANSIVRQFTYEQLFPSSS